MAFQLVARSPMQDDGTVAVLGAAAAESGIDSCLFTRVNSQEDRDMTARNSLL